jgi:hypothetical protein
MHYLLGLWNNSRSRSAIDGAMQMSGELSERRSAVDNDRAARSIEQTVSKPAHSGDTE